jgi:hypothetical protein
MKSIRFETKLFSINTWTILQLPKSASAKLPSRGQTMVRGKLNGVNFISPLEPDGKGSHWFKVDQKLLTAAHAAAGDTVSIELESIKDWPEPEVSQDWQKALSASKKAGDLWQNITPMARWEWIRWARATNNTETFARRIKVGISKMESGERRPCCWNRNLCTEPSVSKNGVLLESTPALV